MVSGVDPKRTFLRLLDPAQLDPTFANRMKNFRASGNVAKTSNTTVKVRQILRSAIASSEKLQAKILFLRT